MRAPDSLIFKPVKASMNPHGYMCEHVGTVFLGLDLVAAKE